MDNNYLNAQKMLAAKATSVHTLSNKPEYYVMVSWLNFCFMTVT